ncbi:hypothetical protein [Peredibacter starrii]|uniref:Uncharacterized protein n=1 Tax=Peredibacter starrii TaxID=28202 RepID=A0AAX4HKU4_9BACT|nr:hypothetical protein [Peredibacter starrii]WPU63594.1 hypothetical protein SOO65_12930 [Peredibacter starrii]
MINQLLEGMSVSYNEVESTMYHLRGWDIGQGNFENADSKKTATSFVAVFIYTNTAAADSIRIHF